jgi:hypothetical protein
MVLVRFILITATLLVRGYNWYSYYVAGATSPTLTRTPPKPTGTTRLGSTKPVSNVTSATAVALETHQRENLHRFDFIEMHQAQTKLFCRV